jgi:hypothetical protein
MPRSGAYRKCARLCLQQSRKMIAESAMLSREYLQTARSLLGMARNMADQAIADRLRALAHDYEARAEVRTPKRPCLRQGALKDDQRCSRTR